jgi:hypothetical protein
MDSRTCSTAAAIRINICAGGERVELQQSFSEDIVMQMM